MQYVHVLLTFLCHLAYNMALYSNAGLLLSFVCQLASPPQTSYPLPGILHCFFPLLKAVGTADQLSKLSFVVLRHKQRSLDVHVQNLKKKYPHTVARMGGDKEKTESGKTFVNLQSFSLRWLTKVNILKWMIRVQLWSHDSSMGYSVKCSLVIWCRYETSYLYINTCVMIFVVLHGFHDWG